MLRILVANLLLVVVSTHASLAQSAPPSSSSPPATKVVPGVPIPSATAPAVAAPAVAVPAVAVPGVAPEQRRNPPLLREGSFLVRAGGDLRNNAERNEWSFVPALRDSTGLEREIILLPNDTLSEAIRTLRLAPSPIRFEASGELFIYRSRNYLLLSMMSAVVMIDTSSASTVKPTTAAPSQRKPAAATPMDEEAIAADLERRLADRIGTLPKAPTVVPVTRRDSERPASATAAQPASEARLMSRSGHLMRDAATGGWRFVFEGQLPDGGDPSMPVLPCLALERIEQLVRETESQAPLLVSGFTTSFEGRTYLLPSSFRIARGGKGVNP